MTRTKRGNVAQKRRQKKLKMVKGFRGNSSLLFKNANQRFLKAFQNAFTGRRLRKRFFRDLWIIRINAKARQVGFNYNNFIYNNNKINRKILAQLSILDPFIFYKFLKNNYEKKI